MAKKVITATNNFTRRNLISIGGAGISLKDLKDGTEIKVKACALVQDDSDPENIKDIAAFVDETGNIYSSISANMVDCVPDIVDLFNDDGEEEVSIRIIKRKSKSDREFLSLLVL